MRKLILLYTISLLSSFKLIAQNDSNKNIHKIKNTPKEQAENITTQPQPEEAVGSFGVNLDVANNNATIPASNEEIKKLENAMNKGFAEIKARLKDDDQSTIIGELKLIGSQNIKVTKYDKTQDDQVDKNQLNIDSIRVETIDGYITSIFAYAKSPDERVFMNVNAPITLSSKRFNQIEYLKCFHKGEWEYIKVFDILSFRPIKNFIPDNESFVLKPNDFVTHTFKKGVGINTIFDLRLYSDALAAWGSTPNGLVLTEGYFKQVLHRYNFPNLGIYAFSTLKINFNLSKFDSKIASVDSTYFSRSSLFQRSWFNGDISLGIIKGWLAKRSASSWYIDIGGGVSLSKLAGLNDTSDITSTYLFIQPGADINVSENIGVTISSRIMYHYRIVVVNKKAAMMFNS